MESGQCKIESKCQASLLLPAILLEGEEEALGVEKLKDERKEGSETDHTKLLMKQAMCFMTDVFQNLKAHKTLARMTSGDTCQAWEEIDGKRMLSLDIMAGVSATPADAPPVPRQKFWRQLLHSES